jgi:ribonucleoside-triphosphate reductase
MIIKSYLNNSSWRIKENASAGYSVGAMNNMIASKESASYWLNEICSVESAQMHKDGDIHIHDLCMVAPYCNGWSLRELLQDGFGGIENKVTSAPANHLYTACQHIINFMGVMSNESAGAQAFSSIDTLLAPFIKIDNLSYKDVKQAVQTLVYGLNVESRWAGQPPFTNLTFDWVCPEDMKDLAAIAKGIPQDFTYGELQAEMDMINKAFLEIMVKGDYNGRLFSYPINLN